LIYNKEADKNFSYLDTLSEITNLQNNMNIKKITILIICLLVLIGIYYFIVNKGAILDFFGYYQPSPNSVCGKEGESIGGNIEGCCSGLKSKPAEPVVKNGDGGLFICSK
jgi:hypothetical protein